MGLGQQGRFNPDGNIKSSMDPFPAVSGGVVSGAPWHSQIELNYSYNFGITTTAEGHRWPDVMGFFFWSKELR